MTFKNCVMLSICDILGTAVNCTCKSTSLSCEMELEIQVQEMFKGLPSNSADRLLTNIGKYNVQ
jgi:hypothetical protein